MASLRIIADDDLDDDWSTADLAARINEATASDLSIVLRIVAARLAAQAKDATDPAFVLSDVRHAVESLHATARVVLTEFERIGEADVLETLDHLEAAIGGLYGIAENF